jgi:hypothetical protein
MNVEIPLPTLIQLLLQSRVLQVQIVEEKDVAGELVDVQKGKGLLKCVDGRESDQEQEGAMTGPKMLGGIYAMASIRGVNDAAGLAAIVKEVQDKGYVPTVHGHEHPTTGEADSMGCGYFKLWKHGKLAGLTPPNFTGDEGRDAVKAADGVYEVLKDKHYEAQVVINLVGGKTLAPNHNNQQFVVDGWAIGEFGLDLLTYLGLAASTVEQLSTTCRTARIVVPSVSA